MRSSPTGPHLRKLLVRRKPDFATSCTRGAELANEVRLGVFRQVHAVDGFPALSTRFSERGSVRGTAPSAPQDRFFSRWRRHCLRHRLCRSDPHGEKRADQDDESFHRTLSGCATRGWLCENVRCSFPFRLSEFEEIASSELSTKETSSRADSSLQVSQPLQSGHSSFQMSHR